MAAPKTILITGCSDGGIGGALALVFQSRGFHVFATARNLSRISALARLPRVTLLMLDVTNPSHIEAAVEAVRRETRGTLDYLVNNSGTNHVSPVLDDKIDEAKRTFDTNLWGALAVTQGFAPLLIKAKGTIVNITSISGHVNVPWMGLYAASKRALEIVSETLRLEIAPFGVRVLAVTTGAVKSKGQTYFQDWKLRPSSIYRPIEAKIASRARGNDGVARMDTMKYANKVASDIEGGARGRVWRGVRAGMVRFGSVFLPTRLMDSLLVKGTGLDSL